MAILIIARQKNPSRSDMNDAFSTFVLSVEPDHYRFMADAVVRWLGWCAHPTSEGESSCQPTVKEVLNLKLKCSILNLAIKIQMWNICIL